MNFARPSLFRYSKVILNAALEGKVSSKIDMNTSVALAWGMKPSAKKIETIASNKNLEILRLEDGFLRSFSSGKIYPALSLVIDHSGIYYNSEVSSDVEGLLKTNFPLYKNRDHLISIEKIKKFQLSKYNSGIECESLSESSSVKKILVVDQTYGDLSVVYGGGSSESFAKMFNASLNENPSATIYVKTHPEVTSGRKKGYLTHIQDSDRIVMIREDVNPINLIQKMDKVYVVTSHMGFEALMCGKPVVCFGVPWYAGWGLTDDRVKDSPAWARRTKRRTVEELFAAAYLHYTRYLNPFTHERGTIFDVIEWLVLQKKMVANQFKRSF